MKIPCTSILWVAILLGLNYDDVEAKANWDVVKAFQGSWSKNSSSDVVEAFQDSWSRYPNGPDGEIAKGRLPTWEEMFFRAFQLKNEDFNVRRAKWPHPRCGMRTVVACVLTVAAASIASVGGIGGGGLFLAILNLVLEFDSRTSAIVSTFMVLGGSMANVIFCIHKRHPELSHKPLVDYDVALLVQPNMLLGISLGVICNVMFPAWLTTLLLVLLLSIMTFKSFKNAFKQWQAESLIHQRGIGTNPEKNNALPSLPIAESPDNQRSSSSSIHGIPKKTCNELHSENVSMHVPTSFLSHESSESLHETLLKVKSRQSIVFPLKELAILVVVWFSFFLVNLLKGGKDKKNLLHIQRCGLAYWLISGLQIPLALTTTICMVYQSGNSENHFSQQVSSKAIRYRDTFMFSSMGLATGMLGGMLGVGGGMLISPFLLQIGLPPQVTAATCAFMVFFSSSMSVAQFLLLGLAPLKYSLFFAAICFISSIFSLLIIQRAIRQNGRVSLIIFSVSTVLGISAILMTTFGAVDVWRQYQDGDYMGFRAPC